MNEEDELRKFEEENPELIELVTSVITEMEEEDKEEVKANMDAYRKHMPTLLQKVSDSYNAAGLKHSVWTERNNMSYPIQFTATAIDEKCDFQVRGKTDIKQEYYHFENPNFSEVVLQAQLAKVEASDGKLTAIYIAKFGRGWEEPIKQFASSQGGFFRYMGERAARMDICVEKV